MNLFIYNGDEIKIWIPTGGGSIHIKTYEMHGDPVELGEEEALEIGQLLIYHAMKMKRQES